MGPVTSMAVQQARTYQVRTYGCQMNVHDSERIAGSAFTMDMSARYRNVR